MQMIQDTLRDVLKKSGQLSAPKLCGWTKNCHPHNVGCFWHSLKDFKEGVAHLHDEIGS